MHGGFTHPATGGGGGGGGGGDGGGGDGGGVADINSSSILQL
jgi:hypothetical protein